MPKPHTPPPIAERQKRFEQKIAQQKPLPPSTPPTPMMPPRIVPSPFTKGK